MLLGWPRSRDSTVEPGLGRAFVEWLRIMASVALASAVCMPGYLFALDIVSHQLHWTHAQSDQAVHGSMAAVVAAVGLYLLALMVWSVVSRRNRDDDSVPGRGFELAASLVLFGSILVPVLCLALIYAALVWPNDHRAIEVVGVIGSVLSAYPYAWLAGAMAVYFLLRVLAGQAAKTRRGLERLRKLPPAAAGGGQDPTEPLGDGAGSVADWNVPLEITATRTRSVVGAIVLIALSVAAYIAYVAYGQDRTVWILCAAAFFGVSSVVLFIKFLFPDRLTIREAGFRYETFRGVVIDASWSEIGEFQLWSYSSSASFIIFDVSAAVRPSVRFQAGNAAMVNADVCLTASWPMPASQLVAKLNGARDRWSNRC